jgi:DNA-binding CsgD family transcriptional regulator
MKINNNDLLIKLIEIQSYIIQGKDVKALIHKNSNIYLECSGADIITICMSGVKKVDVEHVFEKEKRFKPFLKKYLLNKKISSYQSFIPNYQKCFINNKHYYETTNLIDIFKGILSNNETTNFMNDIQMEEALIMPIFDIEIDKTIGYITYIFKEKNKKDLVKIQEMNEFFQILIQPLYDYKNHQIFSKCVRIDRHFNLLTYQEKRIIRKVLRGKSYVEIGKIMNISINTIKTHIKNIFNKYNVRSKMELYNKIIDNLA